MNGASAETTETTSRLISPVSDVHGVTSCCESTHAHQTTTCLVRPCPCTASVASSPRGEAVGGGLREVRSWRHLPDERAAMEDYPPIEDHGLIGDLQTAALVTKDGSIDWFCCPRFDSPSVFASLLDSDRGGHFRVAPRTSDYTARQMYFPDSAILITRFMTEDGVGEVRRLHAGLRGSRSRPTSTDSCASSGACAVEMVVRRRRRAAVRLRTGEARDHAHRSRCRVPCRRRDPDPAPAAKPGRRAPVDLRPRCRRRRARQACGSRPASCVG